MKLINKIFFIIILSFSIFGCSFFEEDITSPNKSKSLFIALCNFTEIFIGIMITKKI